MAAQRGNGLFTPDEQRDDSMRENDDVAEREDWKGASCHSAYMGGGPCQRNGGLAESDDPTRSDVLQRMGRGCNADACPEAALAPDHEQRRKDQEGHKMPRPIPPLERMGYPLPRP